MSVGGDAGSMTKWFLRVMVVDVHAAPLVHSGPVIALFEEAFSMGQMRVGSWRNDMDVLGNANGCH